ncbi:hypothetical protein [Paraconexibacter algicola]|uniref:Uncharacterized protein n=1 Tax=Paraconexibacter algicola TaxID=2133960 RepID=A0A2T4UKL7_9ACTN|nr:hypothetical protein [Paraconexibacter algicola]PTL59770.1 hypothetical protein C7Y72_08950 [Paraconexibacter algicola]
MTPLLAQADPAIAEKPAGGAPIADILIVGGGISLTTFALLGLILAYRRGGAPRFRAFETRVERAVGLPGWAAIPGLGAILGSLLTIWGATWDIGLHIDVGRDEGPLGTAAHYPLLFGLIGMFLMGVLSVGMAPRRPSASSSVAFRVRGVGTVPAAAALLAGGSAFALLGFPLDDLWHRIFGQDVTLWGPTHTMFIGGVLAAGTGAALLLAEGARAAGRDPFGAKGLLRRPIAGLIASIFLYLWTASLAEFNWGVPQYREIWMPMILAFGGAHTMVLARILGGRGGTFGALAVWMPMQVAMTLAIGGPLDTTMPAMPLFVAEALIIEAVAWRGLRGSPLRFGLVAGAGVGTIGLAANYAWTQVAYPVAWEPALLTEAIPVALLAGLAGGALGALMGQALTGTLPAGPRPLRTALAAAALALGLCVNAAIVQTPQGETAEVRIANVREAVAPGGDRTQVANVTVRLSDPEVAQDGNWAYILGWQGNGRYAEPLVRQADGTLRSSRPVPIGGTWKSFVRFHKGRTMISAPIRMPADPALDFAGFAAEPVATRTMIRDTKLLQIERREDGPTWAWMPALLLVLAMDVSLLVLMAWICVRLGRMRGQAPTVQAPPGFLIEGADRVIREVEKRVPVGV